MSFQKKEELIKLTLIGVLIFVLLQFSGRNRVNFFVSQAAISQIYSGAEAVQDIGSTNVWMLWNSKKRIIPSANIFEKLGFKWDNIRLASTDELDKFPSVKIAKSSQSGQIYYLTDTGYKYLLRNQNILDSSFFGQYKTEIISQEELDAYPETKLIRLDGDSRVFLVEDGKRRWISSGDVFEKMYDWNMIVTTGWTDFYSYPYGDEIKGALWLDKYTIGPLEEVKINFLLSEPLNGNLKIVDNQNEKVFNNEKYVLPIKDGVVKIKVGDELGSRIIYFETADGLVTPKIEFKIKTETSIKSGIADLDNFYPQVKKWMLHNVSYCQGAKGYRSPDTRPIWVRDHTHQFKGFCYWEEDVKNIIDWFFEHQRSDGSFYDYCLGSSGIRIDLEADVEYLMVLAAHRVWQATGDDEWMFSHLRQLEKALKYSMTHTYRWDNFRRLVKRGFTIDTWDFHWGIGVSSINKNTSFGFMSGDNSGMYEAARILSEMYDLKGAKSKKDYWKNIAETFKEKSNYYLWDNERGYFTSFVHIDAPVPPVEIDEKEILSLSNVYNLNRGDFISQSQAVKIISEYQKRAETASWRGQNIFQEWFSVNPDYGYNKWGTISADESGEYVNGGVMPLVGGELSMASFEHGFEEYGYQELREYIDLTRSHNNKTFLWYWPNGEPGKSGEDTLTTDGWGSGAFLNAFIRGLAGVKDLSKLYQRVKVSPRWPVTETENVRAIIKYGASDAYFAYNWNLNQSKKQIKIEYTGSGDQANFHILLPENTQAVLVTINDYEVSFVNNNVENSSYVDFGADIDGLDTAIVYYR